MAKVYDALRRAEEQRRERAGQSNKEVAAPLTWEPPARTPKVPRGEAKSSLWGRVRGWLPGKPVDDGAGDVNKRRIALLQPDSYVAEQFRTLRARIDSMAAERPITSIAIASAMPGEGKSTAAINMAIVTAMQIDTKVCLVDCDMRKPKIHRSLLIQPEVGLAEVLAGEASVEEALTPVPDLDLKVLGVRGLPKNPSELLATNRMREVIQELSERFDRVIVDTPAALQMPDAKVVSGMCDGILLVVRADMTTQDQLEDTLEFLDRRRVLGLVLNGVRAPQGRYSYYPY
jgi:capsular exopolysaccharide synthesis family protein